MELKVIAHIKNDFTEKFGIPRQSGIVNSVESDIVFEPQYRVADAFRGLEQYTHLWLLWEFSEAVRDEWSPTVRPPRLGGNKRMGVFATRSPFRPNPIGLSCVKIENIRLNTPNGPVITVSGADIMNDTPIYDIKPYLAYADSHPEASNGFALSNTNALLKVVCDEEILTKLPSNKRTALIDTLAQDPRPQYQNEPDRIYTMSFAGFDVSFRVDEKTLTVTKIVEL